MIDQNPEIRKNLVFALFGECFGDFKTNEGQIGEASVRAPSVRIRGEWSGKSETVESEDRDVVGLAETLRLFGDAMRCLGADFTSTFETEKLAGCTLGFHDAVGEQREVIAGIQRKRAFFVLCVGNDAERQRTGYLDLPTVAVKGRGARHWQ